MASLRITYPYEQLENMLEYGIKDLVIENGKIYLTPEVSRYFTYMLVMQKKGNSYDTSDKR